MNVVYIALQVSGYLVVVFSLIPLIRKDYWAFRVFEYPRLQKLVLNLVIIFLFLFLYPADSIGACIFIAALILNALYLLYQVYPFTPLAEKKMLKATHVSDDDVISLIISNVYQYNRNAKGCLALYKKYDPDVILLVETDSWWVDQLRGLEEAYPFKLLFPLSNTYGMSLYSKLELSDEEIKFLIENDVPSVHTKIKLRSGKKIKLYGLHPMPPVPDENPRSTERDKEILKVGSESKNSDLPVIVAGDLNDVAWSYTTELFTKISGLLDPRIGRGFFNTFHAKVPFMRFPLDHVFCSNDFTLIDLKRLPNCGSDHFPMFIKLHYNSAAKAVQDEPQAKEEEKEMAEHKMNKPT